MLVHRPLAAGAINVTCAKLGKAEVVAQADIRGILIANQIVGWHKGVSEKVKPCEAERLKLPKSCIREPGLARNLHQKGAPLLLEHCGSEGFAHIPDISGLYSPKATGQLERR